MTSDPPTAMQFGVGPIGARIVEVAIERGYEFVGGIDIDPEKVGADLGAVAGLDTIGAEVTDDPAAIRRWAPDIVFHSTVSSVENARPQLETALSAGADVVSTCEELSYPYRDNPAVAEALDATAREHGTACLGTGINPGFAMDALPAALTGACQQVDSIRVERVQDAAQRRGPLQAKIGAGTSVETFEAEVATEAGHVGLPESVAMLAAGLDWELEAVEETIEPVIAEDPVASDHVTVAAGEVAGIHQRAIGTVDGMDRIELSLDMYLGAPDPHDAVHIEGTPDVDYRVAGGFHGDLTTPAVVVNAVPPLRQADPGLHTMLDLSIPTCAGP